MASAADFQSAGSCPALGSSFTLPTLLLSSSAIPSPWQRTLSSLSPHPRPSPRARPSLSLKLRLPDWQPGPWSMVGGHARQPKAVTKWRRSRRDSRWPSPGQEGHQGQLPQDGRGRRRTSPTAAARRTPSRVTMTVAVDQSTVWNSPEIKPGREP
jgi:hypothetical protein